MAGIIAYADGGCSPNPGPGGWGVFIETPDGTVALSGGDAGTTTNNRMELTAAIEALSYFPEGTVIEMRCDSRYVVDSAKQWIRNWKRNGWRSATGDVKNVDLMKRLDDLMGKRDVRWTWVRGHDGNDGNEKADALVHLGRNAARTGVTKAEPVVTGKAPSKAPPGGTDVADAGRATPAAAPAGPRPGSVPIDLALGLQVSRAARAAGVTPQEFVEEAVRLALALGPAEVTRLASGRPAA